MAFQQQGNSGVVAEVNSTFRALRIEGRPIDYGNLGHFRIARRLVPASTTLAGILWTMRWTDATRFGILLALRLKVLQVAAPTAAIEDIFNAKIVRSYSAADSTGSASIAPAAAMQKMRTSMANSLMEIRESNIAAGASGGTGTSDTDAFVKGSLWVLAALPTAAGQPGLAMEYLARHTEGEHPIVLAQNEGIRISNENAFGATSGITIGLEAVWAEAQVY